MVERPVDQGKELLEFNLADEGKKAHPIFISFTLSIDLKQALLDISRESKDVFVWEYTEMFGLDS